MLGRSVGSLLSIEARKRHRRCVIAAALSSGGPVMQEAAADIGSPGGESTLLKEVSRAFSRKGAADVTDHPSALQEIRCRFRKISQIQPKISPSSPSVSSRSIDIGRFALPLAILPLLLLLLLWFSAAMIFLIAAVPASVAACCWLFFVKREKGEGKGCQKGSCSECRSKEEDEQQLAQRAQRAKQQFMAYVFHNIRVPFNAIVLGLGHMRASSASGEDSNAADTLDLVQLMLDCAETMTNVLDDVTDMGNWEEGRIELNRDVFDLLAVVKFLAWGLKDLLEQKQISLNIDIDPVASNILESHNIVGDKHRTVQTLGNFLSNAVKFTPTGGKLDLELKCEEIDSSSIPHSTINGDVAHKSVKLFIAVNDTGAGISSDDQDRLFEADSFISSSWVQKAGVSGLGLSVAKRFIEQIGGHIGVRSREQGSTFYFSAPFPLVPVQKRANCSSSVNFYTECDRRVNQRGYFQKDDAIKQQFSSSAASPLSQESEAAVRRKVLLVEDTRINRIILRKVLQNLNLQCDEAENGQVAVDLHREGRSYDLVLMDKEMPVMDGHEATRMLRMMGVKTPIVALTGNALQSDKELFFEAGVNEFQTKPLSRDKLIQLLARYGVESSGRTGGLAAAL